MNKDSTTKFNNSIFDNSVPLRYRVTKEYETLLNKKGLILDIINNNYITKLPNNKSQIDKLLDNEKIIDIIELPRDIKEQSIYDNLFIKYEMFDFPKKYDQLIINSIYKIEPNYHLNIKSIYVTSTKFVGPMYIHLRTKKDEFITSYAEFSS